jgi:hypothetical protein
MHFGLLKTVLHNMNFTHFNSKIITKLAELLISGHTGVIKLETKVILTYRKHRSIANYLLNWGCYARLK